VRARELWRVQPEYLDQAQDDATLIAIRDQERAGLDIITDGEMRRESYSNRFATALDGVDLDNPGSALDRSGHPNPVPRVTGRIRRRHAVEVRDVEFLRANTDRQIKITLPGPFTLSMQAHDEYYSDPEAVAMAYAEAVAEEARDLKAAGADIIQFDEPWLQARPEQAMQFGATHTYASIDEALLAVPDLTWGEMCDRVVLSAGVVHGDMLDPARAKYDLKYYVETAKQLKAAGAHVLGLKGQGQRCQQWRHHQQHPMPIRPAALCGVAQGHSWF
jgi:methionine synthase II (cobalamin-independent)